MYTELVFKAEFSKSLDPKVLAALKWMFGDGDKPLELPDHEFFRKGRADCIGHCSSFYHHPDAVNSWYDFEHSHDIHVFSRSDLKNYEGEIEAFLDWVMPYVGNYEGQCIGWTWYEEEDAPTLIFKLSEQAQRAAKGGEG